MLGFGKSSPGFLCTHPGFPLPHKEATIADNALLIYILFIWLA